MKVLDKDNIKNEKTSFSLDSNLTKLRDYEWDKIIQSGQIVEIIQPKRKGGKLKVKAIDSNDLPVEIGTIEFYDEEVNYNKAIICQLIDRDLTYSSGDKRSCLEFNQPIILINSDAIPNEIMASKTLKVKTKGKTKSGCLATVSAFLVFVSIAIELLN